MSTATVPASPVCEICGDNPSESEPHLDPITGIEWWMCGQCKAFWNLMAKEMEGILLDEFDFADDEVKAEREDY